MFDTMEFCVPSLTARSLFWTQKKPNQFGLFLLFPATTSLVEALGLIATWIIKAPFSLLLWRRSQEIESICRGNFLILLAVRIFMDVLEFKFVQDKWVWGKLAKVYKRHEIGNKSLVLWKESWIIMFPIRMSESNLRVIKAEKLKDGVKSLVLRCWDCAILRLWWLAIFSKKKILFKRTPCSGNNVVASDYQKILNLRTHRKTFPLLNDSHSNSLDFRASLTMPTHWLNPIISF